MQVKGPLIKAFEQNLHLCAQLSREKNQHNSLKMGVLRNELPKTTAMCSYRPTRGGKVVQARYQSPAREA